MTAVATVKASGWMTTAEVSTNYPFTETALAQMRHAKKGPRFAKHGRIVRYHRDDIESWLREGFAE